MCLEAWEAQAEQGSRTMCGGGEGVEREGEES